MTSSSEWMYLAIALNCWIYGLGIYIVIRNGGLRNNISFAFTWLLFIIYYFITPTYFYSIGRKTIWGDEGTNYGVGVNILDYYDDGLFFYGMANFLLLIGYITIKSKPQAKPSTKNKFNSKIMWRAVVGAFMFCFLLVAYNFASEGFNLLNLIVGSADDSIAGLKGSSNYLKNFSDSLIAVLICGFFYKLPKRLLIPMTIISFFLFILMGFRYRIILTLLGFAFTTIYRVKLHMVSVLKFIPVIFLFFYFMLFITYNRYTFTTASWEQIEYNPAEFDFGIVFEQTRGMLDDITILKYYATAENPKSDFGISFVYFFVRILPRSIVGDKFKDSLYPPPAFPIIEEAYDVIKVWGSGNTGEAPLHLAYFVISFGISGLWVFSYLGGIFLKWLKNRLNRGMDNDILIQILFTSALFQWITRGYFPGFVDHLAFMLLGFYLIRMIYGFHFRTKKSVPL